MFLSSMYLFSITVFCDKNVNNRYSLRIFLCFRRSFRKKKSHAPRCTALLRHGAGNAPHRAYVLILAVAAATEDDNKGKNDDPSAVIVEKMTKAVIHGKAPSVSVGRGWFGFPALHYYTMRKVFLR
jgi:hypothetical protein